MGMNFEISDRDFPHDVVIVIHSKASRMEQMPRTCYSFVKKTPSAAVILWTMYLRRREDFNEVWGTPKDTVSNAC